MKWKFYIGTYYLTARCSRCLQNPSTEFESLMRFIGILLHVTGRTISTLEGIIHKTNRGSIGILFCAVLCPSPGRSEEKNSVTAGISVRV